MNDTLLTPAAMADRTGVTIDTLRYYEREGLIEPVARADSGHRRYSDADIAWVQVLRCLRATGMTIEQLRRYCELGSAGPATEAERLAMLREHRRLVEDQIAERREALGLIDHKIDGYVENATAVTPQPHDNQLHIHPHTESESR